MPTPSSQPPQCLLMVVHYFLFVFLSVVCLSVNTNPFNSVVLLWRVMSLPRIFFPSLLSPDLYLNRSYSVVGTEHCQWTCHMLCGTDQQGMKDDEVLSSFSKPGPFSPTALWPFELRFENPFCLGLEKLIRYRYDI